MSLAAHDKVTTIHPAASSPKIDNSIDNPQQGGEILKHNLRPIMLPGDNANNNNNNGGVHSTSATSLTSALTDEEEQDHDQDQQPVASVTVVVDGNAVAAAEGGCARGGAIDNEAAASSGAAPAADATNAAPATAHAGNGHATHHGVYDATAGMAGMSLQVDGNSTNNFHDQDKQRRHIHTINNHPTNVMMLNNNIKTINHVKIPATQHDNRKLFVGGLPTNLTEPSFLNFFEQYGEVIDSVVMIDRTTKRSRGFGFITFANEDVALSLLTTIPGRTGTVNIMGKSCEVKASEPKADGASGQHHHGAHRGGGWNNAESRSAGGSNGGGRVPTVVLGGTTSAGAPPKHKYHHLDYGNRGEDSRHFDELYRPHHHSAYYPTYSMNELGRSTAVTSNQQHHPHNYPAMYHPHANYHHPSASAGGDMQGGEGPTSYPYPDSTAWEATYPGPTASGADYGSYSTAAGAGAGSVSDHHQYAYYAHQGQYPNSSMYNQYSNMGGNVAGGMHPSYAHYSSYYATSARGAPAGVQTHGAYPSEGSLESYPQQVSGGGYPVSHGGVAGEEYNGENYDTSPGAAY